MLIHGVEDSPAASNGEYAHNAYIFSGMIGSHSYLVNDTRAC